MVDNTKKELEFEPLEDRVAPILVVAPAPEPAPAPGGGGGAYDPGPIVGIPENPPKHWNPGWIRKTPV